MVLGSALICPSDYNYREDPPNPVLPDRTPTTRDLFGSPPRNILYRGERIFPPLPAAPAAAAAVILALAVAAEVVDDDHYDRYSERVVGVRAQCDDLMARPTA